MPPAAAPAPARVFQRSQHGVRAHVALVRGGLLRSYVRRRTHRSKPRTAFDYPSRCSSCSKEQPRCMEGANIVSIELSLADTHQESALHATCPVHVPVSADFVPTEVNTRAAPGPVASVGCWLHTPSETGWRDSVGRAQCVSRTCGETRAPGVTKPEIQPCTILFRQARKCGVWGADSAETTDNYGAP